jgi:hypothetical protein
VVDESFAEQSRYEAEIVTERKIFLSISYCRGILNPWQADDAIVPASHCVRSTVLVSKLSEVVVARFGIVCKDSNSEGGVSDFNMRNIEAELSVMLSVAHVNLASSVE